MNSRLRDKVGALSPDDLRHMEQAGDHLIATLGGEFHAYTRGALAEIDALMAASRCEDDTWRARLNVLAHDLKGLGGTFGYDLMTIIADSMCRTIRDHAAVTSDSLRRQLAALAVALNAIVQLDLRGDGGEKGRQLLASLRLPPTRKLPGYGSRRSGT